MTEQNKKPDFVFPSAAAYYNPGFSDLNLHMLASKTCCKDRWRQVINEADRIRQKHLFTLQEGVSSNQLAEMYASGITLVVPQPNMHSFPVEYRDKIMNLTGFVDYIKNSQKKFV
ncbi:Type-2 restriction enzyme EcoRII [bioreactor metagenome]|uniref:Type-2 restriction enzyme EcoRII n=1 Tax=bioreactor metagenome TaxID=1076179 RepID=A0A645E3M2_9ZZZZ